MNKKDAKAALLKIRERMIEIKTMSEFHMRSMTDLKEEADELLDEATDIYKAVKELEKKEKEGK